MATIQNLVSKLTGSAQPYNWLVDKFNSPGESKRTRHFQKLYDFYMGDRQQIVRYMQTSMSVMFKPETLQKMLYPHVDVVRKIINRTSLAYKEPAERYIDPTGTANDAYQELLEGSDINVKAKTWNRLAKLLDTVYVAPMWREDHIEFDIFPPHLISVRENPKNYLEPLEVIYEMQQGDRTVKVFWSETQNFYLDSEGRKVATEENPSGANPYKILPFVPCRLRETENHWGEGDTELVDVAEKASILLASTYFNAIMQSHGQPVGINLGIEKSKDNPEGQIKTGPDTIIHAEQVSKELAPPSFHFEQPNPATESCLKQIDWMVRTAAVMRGLTADSVSIDRVAQSGAAKEIDNYELMELREDDIEALRLFEKKLFEVTVAVWNYHSTPQIPEGSQFICDFAEITIPPTIPDEIAKKEFDYAKGLWTPVDDLIDEDEGVDEAKAVEIITKNLELKKQIDAITAPVQVGGGIRETSLALQQIALARTRAIEAGDTALAKELGDKMNQLGGSLGSSGQ